MNIIILFPLVLLWRICHAGWPCCLRGQREEDEEQYARIVDDTDVPTGDQNVSESDQNGHSGDQNVSGSDQAIHSSAGAKSPTLDVHALDISNPSDSLVVHRDEIRDGINWKIFVPRLNAEITRIVDGKIKLVDIEGSFRYLKISQGKNKILFVHSRTRNGWKICCLEKANRGWYNREWQDRGGGELRRSLAFGSQSD